MFYKAEYKINEEKRKELLELKEALIFNYMGYYAMHGGGGYFCDAPQEVVRCNNFKDKNGNYSWVDEVSDLELDSTWGWVTCAGNRATLDVKGDTLIFTLDGVRHGLQDWFNFGRNLGEPRKVIKYDSWRKDSSPFECGLSAKKVSDGERRRWLVKAGFKDTSSILELTEKEAKNLFDDEFYNWGFNSLGVF